MDDKPRSVLGGCLKFAAAISLLAVLLMGAAIGWSLQANSVADGRAQAFCEATRKGEPVQAVLRRAQADATMKNHYEDAGVQHFNWQGGMFYAAECAVATADGRVASARRVTHDD